MKMRECVFGRRNNREAMTVAKVYERLPEKSGVVLSGESCEKHSPSISYSLHALCFYNLGEIVSKCSQNNE